MLSINNGTGISVEFTVVQKLNQGTSGPECFREDVLGEAEVSFAGLFFWFFFGEAKKNIQTKSNDE